MDADREGQKRALEALTTEVKSRILDRVLADLTEGLGLGTRASGYTKSDSGIYGKYQKSDIDVAEVLAAIRQQMDVLLAEYQHSDSESENRSLEDGSGPHTRHE